MADPQLTLDDITDQDRWEREGFADWDIFDPEPEPEGEDA